MVEEDSDLYNIGELERILEKYIDCKSTLLIRSRDFPDRETFEQVRTKLRQLFKCVESCNEETSSSLNYMWNKFKSQKLLRINEGESNLQDALDEFTWKQLCANNSEHNYLRVLNAIARQYPLDSSKENEKDGFPGEMNSDRQLRRGVLDQNNGESTKYHLRSIEKNDQTITKHTSTTTNHFEVIAEDVTRNESEATTLRSYGTSDSDSLFLANEPDDYLKMIQLFQQKKVIMSEPPLCKSCKKTQELRSCIGKSDKYLWKCLKCFKTLTIRKGSFFEKIRATLIDLNKIIECWSKEIDTQHAYGIAGIFRFLFT